MAVFCFYTKCLCFTHETLVSIFLRSLDVICYDRWVVSESQKLLQGLVSHELTAYLSIFKLSYLNELWSYYQKNENQIISNHITLWSLALRIFKAFVQILLIVNLSLNQILLKFLLYVRQTWLIKLILAIYLWRVIFL